MQDDGMISPYHPSQTKLNGSIQLLLSQYNDIIYDQGADVMYMDCNTLVNTLRIHKSIEGDFIKYARAKSKRYRELGKFALFDTYDTTINHIIKYTKNEKIPFKAINVQYLQNLELYFRYKGLSTNSISVYMRNIRAIFNDAIDEIGGGDNELDSDGPEESGGIAFEDLIDGTDEDDSDGDSDGGGIPFEDLF